MNPHFTSFIRPTQLLLRSTISLWLLAFASTGRAQVPAVTPVASPPPIQSELAKHRYTLSLVDGRLQGDGAEFLAKEAAKSQFMLVGEDHGLAQMPRFTAALFNLIRPAGYGHIVVEVGPLVAGYLTHMAAAPNAQTQFADFNRDYPYSVAFYGWREEAEMLEQVVKSLSAAIEPVWGIDQEFIGAGALHLERLDQLAPDDVARAAVRKFLDYARQDMPRMVKQKTPLGTFVLSARPGDYEQLRAAFATADPEALTIIRELERSSAIYAMFGDGRAWLSNFDRARLAKEHFRAYYDRALKHETALPRALFKYGAFHAKRGRSLLGVNDIGNMASELAEFNGLSSFHIMVIIGRGTQNTYEPSVGDLLAKQRPYDAIKDYASILDVRPLMEAADPAIWTLFDVRPLRQFLSRRYKDLDRGLIETLWGFDAVLVIPEGSASTLFE